MGPFKPHVQKAIAAIRDLDIRMICPSHGPVLNRDPMGAVNRYEEWSRPEAKGRSPKAWWPMFPATAIPESWPRPSPGSLRKWERTSG